MTYHTTHRFSCGHPRVPENTYKSSPSYYRKKDGTLKIGVWDYCRTCRKEASKAAYQRKKELSTTRSAHE